MTSFSGKNLSCVRGGRLIFQGLSFTALPGQILILTGANGSGKTSLLRLMAGLLEPFAGEIKRESDVLWLGQETPLKPQLTVLENLQFLSGAAGGATDKNNIAQALEKSGLGHIAAFPAGYLSMGQRRRAVLALLHLVKRDIWLLDEPTNHLDREAQDRLIQTIAAHTAQGGIGVISTHAPETWHYFRNRGQLLFGQKVTVPGLGLAAA